MKRLIFIVAILVIACGSTFATTTNQDKAKQKTEQTDKKDKKEDAKEAKKKKKEEKKAKAAETKKADPKPEQKDKK